MVVCRLWLRYPRFWQDWGFGPMYMFMHGRVREVSAGR